MFTIMKRTLDDDLELSSKVHFQHRETPINAILGLQRAIGDFFLRSIVRARRGELSTNTIERVAL
jgi:hypothetical protein